MKGGKEKDRDGGGEFGDVSTKHSGVLSGEEKWKEDKAVEEESVEIEGEGTGERAEKGDGVGGVGREGWERVGKERIREIGITVQVVLGCVAVVLGEKRTPTGTSSAESCGLSDA